MTDTKKDDAPEVPTIALSAREMTEILQTARHRTAVLCAIIDDRNNEIEAIVEHLSKQTFYDAEGKQVWPEQAIRARAHMANVTTNSERNIVARLGDETVLEAMVQLYIMAMAKPSMASQPLVYMFFEAGSFASQEMMRVSNDLHQQRVAAGTVSEDYTMAATSDIPMSDGIAVKVAIMTTAYAKELIAEFARCCQLTVDLNGNDVADRISLEAVTVIGCTHFGFSSNDYDIPIVAMARSRAVLGNASRQAAEA